MAETANDWGDYDDVFLSSVEHRRRAELLLRSVRLVGNEVADAEGTVMESYGTGAVDALAEEYPGQDAVTTGLNLLAALTHAVIASVKEEQADA